jgi:hypothetical protein
MGKTFGIGVVAMLGGAMPSGIPVTVGGDILWITSCNFWSKQTERGPN